MYARREVNPSSITNKRMLFIISIMAISLCSVCVYSILGTKCRLDAVEYKYQLLVNEMKSIFGVDQLETTTQLSRPSMEKHFRMLYLASLERILNKKGHSIDAMALNQYLDQSGRSDYALASAGARIVSIGETQLVGTPIQWWHYFKQNRLAENSNSNGPHNVLQPSIYPGECFAFYDRGEIHIKLVRAVYIDAVGIEHILPQMSPDGNIKNAPRQFNVYGVLESADVSPIRLGSFRYDINKARPLQLFAVAKNATTQRIQSVRFEFLSNHGAKNTCVYRIRVFGSVNLIN